MKKLNFYIRAIYLSLYSRLFYAISMKSRTLSGVNYLILLAMVISVPLAIEARIIMNRVLNNSGESWGNYDHVISQMPQIIIDKGKFKTNLPENEQNRKITSASGNVVMIFDTADNIKNIDEYPGVLILGSDELKYKIQGSSSILYLQAAEMEASLSKYFTQNADGSKTLLIKNFSEDMKQVLQAPFLVLTIFFGILFASQYILSSLIWSFAVGFFLRILAQENNFSFSQCFRIAAFTTTPVAILSMLSHLMGGGLFMHASVVYFVTRIIYIHFAVESYKRLRQI